MIKSYGVPVGQLVGNRDAVDLSAGVNGDLTSAYGAEATHDPAAGDRDALDGVVLVELVLVCGSWLLGQGEYLCQQIRTVVVDNEAACVVASWSEA